LRKFKRTESEGLMGVVDIPPCILCNHEEVLLYFVPIKTSEFHFITSSSSFTFDNNNTGAGFKKSTFNHYE